MIELELDASIPSAILKQHRRLERNAIVSRKEQALKSVIPTTQRTSFHRLSRQSTVVCSRYKNRTLHSL
jgi:hypothetical protein